MSFQTKISYSSVAQLRHLEKVASYLKEEVTSLAILDDHVKIESIVPISTNSLHKLKSDEYLLEIDEEVLGNTIENNTQINRTVLKDIIDFGFGKVGYKGDLLALRNQVTASLQAMTSDCEERHYPSMLNEAHMAQTGYLDKSRHHAIETCNCDGDACYLTPSSCFHTYKELEGRVIDTNKSLTFTQHVFREEGKFTYNQPWRLKDYYVRECVFIGESTFVESQLEKYFEMFIEYLEANKVRFKVYFASDPFVDVELKKLRILQVKTKVKREVRIICGEEEISVASFNLHGNYFSDRFNIRMTSGSKAQTACIGFGIDRILIGMGLQGVSYE
ncbi:hypothetical protein [Vibrio bivalvicida]|uniref:Aminoacyl-transfer RNA synthetases class-II family profile domain-containing protein n=1 Tax=Vibrio bivalvicida TaxID=1276888 RepID=A0ABV4MII8_9VIBR